MADLSDGEYMLSNLQWHKRDEDSPVRPVWGFTTGTLTVSGRKTWVEARFNDQSLSNRFSDLEQDGVRVTLQATLLGESDVYHVPGRAPTLERSGACYVLRMRGKSEDVSRVHAAA